MLKFTKFHLGKCQEFICKGECLFLPLWHLAGAAHIEGLDYCTQPVGSHGDHILTIYISLGRLRIQWGGQKVRGVGDNGRISLPLLQNERGNVTPWRRVSVSTFPIQLCGDEHQPFIQRMPQQLQRLRKSTHTSQKWQRLFHTSKELEMFNWLSYTVQSCIALHTNKLCSWKSAAEWKTPN